MGFDVAALRSRFPALRAGLAHFDGPGGSQVPDAVAGAVAAAMTSPMANRGSITLGEKASDAIVVAARAAMADFLGADPRGVVFGRSMTALTFDLARTLAAGWGPGDEVVVTRLDHDANVRPWVLAAEAAGATVRWLDFDPETCELDDVSTVLSARTRLVAVTGASNLVGTCPDVPRIAEAVHAPGVGSRRGGDGTGALLMVDGVHLSAHATIDVSALGADFFACSPYKFLGPHCGVLASDPALLETLHPWKLAPSTDAVPERFELGTLPYELLAGTTAAVDVLAGIAGSPHDGRRAAVAASMAAVHEHEERLRTRIEKGLAELPGLRVRSRAARRTPTLLVTFDDRDPVDAHRFLAERRVSAPSGSFYALEASRRLGLGDSGSLRIGLAPYVDDSDVDRLLDGLSAFVAS
ncbi:cysteine desulfurase-like protein [Pseudonocardia endophytica]|uniref:Cysteine desulfurase family protein (TIGR01976 family) n=1 Tax=Pseudonocardia endophytica TaxID=401976 RepID=A0A4R1HQ46_PSEEN|nr:cysteine desulfurase-like protein [Pseudonocardia endophytica]TCK22580.1 cysteine desulfurase family protein (TIGR01976 family) [Pseudonocardia endophytica]